APANSPRRSRACQRDDEIVRFSIRHCWRDRPSSLSALGQKRHRWPIKVMSLYPRKRTCAVQLVMSALGQKRTYAPQYVMFAFLLQRPQNQTYTRQMIMSALPRKADIEVSV